MCEALNPSFGTCRVEGHHALHVAGYGSHMGSWPNADFTPPPKPLSATRLAELAIEINSGPTLS